MGLSPYRQRRDFRRTPEPRGGGAGGSGRAFVVQKHDASRLHYDLRLQIGDVLVSWAVPKGPSLDPSHKRLAVHVEDHPLEYASFEGVIPKGEYGGGTVMLWDRGVWTPAEGEDPARGLARGSLKFTLEGERLRGGWTLTRLRAGRAGEEVRDNWLLIKHDDAEAARGEGLEAHQTSVASGRTMGAIAAGARGGASAAMAAQPSGASRARRAAMPREFSPQLATLAEAAPVGEEWIHEIKFDGYRLLAHLEGGKVRLVTRSGKDWTHRFRPIGGALAGLSAESAIIDGEAAMVDAEGRTDFQRLQNAIKARDLRDLVFFAFDLPYLDGFDLTRAPLIERKGMLRALLGGGAGVLRYSEHIEGGGSAVHRNACALALEGIVSKRRDAPYATRRTRDWLKVKCGRRQEFAVIGWTPPEGARKHLGALLLGVHDGEGRLSYAGRVGTGFTAALLKEMRERLGALERGDCPADDPPTTAEGRGARWVEPRLVAEVEFAEWTDEGRLRHPSFQGLREDKPAREVRMERAESNAGAPGRGASKRGARGDDAEVAGVRLSSASRVVYPEQGATKLDLARYYEGVGERMLPHVADRPLSTVRCPRGRSGSCFFQKHLGETLGPPVRAMRVRESGGEADCIAVDSVEGLVALVQFGVLEIHPWGAAAGDPETPGLLTMDLDPGEGVGFGEVKRAARQMKDRLEARGLAAFLKATGGKGLHVVSPLAPGAGWDEVKSFAAGIAREMAGDEPARFVATASKAKRRGKVFVDYLRNGRGATAVSPYSTRARAGAPVAVPMRWDELAGLSAPDRYDLSTLPRRLAALSSDPWEGFEAARRPVPEA